MGAGRGDWAPKPNEWLRPDYILFKIQSFNLTFLVFSYYIQRIYVDMYQQTIYFPRCKVSTKLFFYFHISFFFSWEEQLFHTQYWGGSSPKVLVKFFSGLWHATFYESHCSCGLHSTGGYLFLSDIAFSLNINYNNYYKYILGLYLYMKVYTLPFKENMTQYDSIERFKYNIKN